MLSISTVGEALAYLSMQTGREWSESEIFDAAKHFNIAMHGIVASNARTLVLECGEGRFTPEVRYDLGPNHTTLAVLFPFQVGQLADRGDTLASHPRDYDLKAGELKILAAPVSVTRADVRITAESLGKFLQAWKDAQAGLVPWYRLPPWMQPTRDATSRDWSMQKQPGVSAPAQADDISVSASSVDALAANDDWRANARAIADECFDRDTANNCRDSLANYSKRVADSLGKRGIQGPHRKVISPQTVQREALQGEKWWSNKLK